MARIQANTLARKIINDIKENDHESINEKQIQETYHVSADNAKKAVKILVQEYGFISEDMIEFFPTHELDDLNGMVEDKKNSKEKKKNKKKFGKELLAYTREPKDGVYIEKSINPFSKGDHDKYIYITKELLVKHIEDYLYNDKERDYTAPISLARSLGMTAVELQKLIAKATDEYPIIGKLFEMLNDKYVQDLIDSGKMSITSPQAKNKLGIKTQGEVVPMAIAMYKGEDYD